MTCGCGHGLKLGPDGKKCVDVDECAEGKAHCEQKCINDDPRTSGELMALSINDQKSAVH